MNQRPFVLFIPSLFLLGYATLNIAKKKMKVPEQTAAYAFAGAPGETAPSRAPSSFGTAKPFKIQPLAERVSLTFARDLLHKRLQDKKIPPMETVATREYEEKLKDLTAADGYPDQPEIFLSRLCEQGTAGACPLLWNLLQQPGANDESSIRQEALLILSCVETGSLCQEAIKSHRGSALEKSLTQLSKNYCEGGVKSACETTAAPMENRGGSRMPASEEPVLFQPSPAPSPAADVRSVSLRRCENDSAADCSRVAVIEARNRNLEAASDYADFSCREGFAEGCLQLAKIQYQKTRSWNSIRESLQRLCDQPDNASANAALCYDLARGIAINAEFFAQHRELRTANGLRVAGHLPTYFVASW